MRHEIYRIFAQNKSMKKSLLLICAIPLLFWSCRVNYSFTGASLSADVKTVSVGYFRNVAALVNPRLSDQFTEALKDKLLSETSLRLVNGEADLMFEGEITGYEQTYQGVQADETAGLNRLTVTIKLRYTNNKEPLKSFERSIPGDQIFSSSVNIDSKEDELVKSIISEKLLPQIFNSTVADW